MKYLSTLLLTATLLASPAYAEAPDFAPKLAPIGHTQTVTINSTYKAKKPGEDFKVTPYSVILKNTFEGYNFVINTQDKAQIEQNTFVKCTFTVDGKLYKTPAELKTIVTKLQKDPNIDFHSNKIE